MRALSIGSVGDEPLRLEKSARDIHMHLLGVSRQGKSYLMEHMIRRDILDGHGVCVIDPHGSLYDNLVNWLARHNLDRTHTIHLLDPSDDTWTFGFNPLIGGVAGGEVTTRIDWMIEAFVRVWGGTDMQQTPLLAKCLRSVFYALAEHGLSLAEAQHFTSWNLKNAREALTSGLGNLAFQRVWDELNEGTNERIFKENFASTNSRLVEFLTAPRVLEAVGQIDHVVDFRACMDKGHVVLINLATKNERISANNARVLGAILFNNLFRSAFGRDQKTAKLKPFYCYVDECARFLTDDIAMALDETAKYGLHLVLAHQRLAQLGEPGTDIYDGVMTGAQTKVIFNVASEETAEALSRHLFRQDFDLEKSKPSMEKPVVVRHETIWMNGESHSESHAYAESEASSSGAGLALSVLQQFDAEGEAFESHGETSGESAFSGSASGRSQAHGFSDTVSRQEAMKPVMEIMPGQLESLEEQIHRGIAALRGLPPRHAFVYAPPNTPVRFVTPQVPQPTVLKREVAAFKERVNRNSPYVSPRAEVRKDIARRGISLDAMRHGAMPFRQVEDAGQEEDDGLGY